MWLSASTSCVTLWKVNLMHSMVQLHFILKANQVCCFSILSNDLPIHFLFREVGGENAFKWSEMGDNLTDCAPLSQHHWDCFAVGLSWGPCRSWRLSEFVFVYRRRRHYFSWQLTSKRRSPEELGLLWQFMERGVPASFIPSSLVVCQWADQSCQSGGAPEHEVVRHRRCHCSSADNWWSSLLLRGRKIQGSNYSGPLQRSPPTIQHLRPQPLFLTGNPDLHCFFLFVCF